MERIRIINCFEFVYYPDPDICFQQQDSGRVMNSAVRHCQRREVSK